jgi:hypothetical protein
MAIRGDKLRIRCLAKKVGKLRRSKKSNTGEDIA